MGRERPRLAEGLGLSEGEHDCESCARWANATFQSLFVLCPQCGRERDWGARAARSRRVDLARREQAKAHKRSEAYLRVVQAILDVYDDYVSQYGPTHKHVYFMVTYKAVAKKLNTTTYHVRKALRGGVSFEQVLVDHGRGQFWYSDQFRHFMPKHNADECESDEAWHNAHHLPVLNFEAVA